MDAYPMVRQQYLSTFYSSSSMPFAQGISYDRNERKRCYKNPLSPIVSLQAISTAKERCK